MKFTKISVVAVLLVLCLCLFAGCGRDKTTETETDVITETDPVVTESDKATTGDDPVVTDPVVTDPVETDPVDTDPVVTDPVETDPVVTDPVETDPVETDPKETDPKETDPAETEPKETDATHTCSGVNLVTNATCYQEGTYTTICSTCGKFMGKTTFAAKLPHTPDEANPATCLKPQLCIVCDAVVEEAHNHEFVGAYANDAYATEGGDRPTCGLEGLMTYTCVRGDNAEEHGEDSVDANGKSGKVYTEVVPTVPHEFEGETEYVAPTLLDKGYEKGTCIWCGDGAQNDFAPEAFEDFDDMDADALMVNVLTGDKSGFSKYFEFTMGRDENGMTVATEENGNKFWQVEYPETASGGVTLKDTSGKLAYEIFEISMKLKFFDTDKVRIVSLKGKEETALLSYVNGKLVFGSNEGSVVTLADSSVLKDSETGEYQWVDVKIVVNPRTVDFTFYINDELVVYTETVEGAEPGTTAHKIYDASDVEIVATLNNKNPFGVSGSINSLYMVHYAKAKFGIDDFCVRIPEFHTCETELATYEPTCTEDGYTVMECIFCGAEEGEKTPIPATGHTLSEDLKIVESTCTKQGYEVKYCTVCGAEDDEANRTYYEKLPHTPNMDAATCTENKKCTACGEILEKALGHEGTTTDPLATFCTNGREYGFCTRCQTEIDEIIPAGIAETFDNFTVGKLSSTELAEESKSALAKVMTVTAPNSFTVVEEGSNRYLQKTSSIQVNLADKTGLLATEKFEVSFDLRIDSLAAKENNGGVLSIRQGTTDIRVLSFMGEKRLVFGKVDNDIVLAKDIYKNGEADWINIRVVVDPTTFDYEIYLDGEKALYTEPIVEQDGSIKTHKVYTAANNWEPVKKTQDSGKFPFPTDAPTIDNIHFFHYSNWGASLDNLTVSIVGGTEHNYETKTSDATCIVPDKMWGECLWCGDKINEVEGEIDENAHVLGDPLNNTATCLAGGTAERHCTVDGCDYFITVDTEKLEHRWGEVEVITPATFCDAGEAVRTCLGNNTTECTESEPIVIPAGIIETFENDAVGSSPTFSLLSKAFVVKKSTHTVAEDESGNKYWAKPTTRNDADLYAKTDFLSGNNFTLSFDFAAIKLTNDEGKNAQGGILGLNSRAKAVYDAEGNEINFRTEGDAKSGGFDEMRILSMAQGGGINFWNINSHTATDGSSHGFRLLNTASYLGEYFHFDVEVYPTLTDGILTCIDYKIYINDKLVFESVDAGTYVNEYDGRTYPVKTIKYREYRDEEFTENTFEMATPTWLGRDTGDKDGDGDKTELIMKNKDGDLNPFYTTRAFHVGDPYVQIESIHFFHYSQITHNIDNLAVHVDAVTCQYEHKVEDSTCKDDGAEWDECIFCGKKTNESLIPADPTKHVQSDLIEDTPASCEAPGVAHYECTICEEKMGDDVPLDQLDHDLVFVETAKVSCTQAGEGYDWCTLCEKQIGDAITVPMLPHTLDEATASVVTPATFTTEGEAVGNCTVCGGVDVTVKITRQVSADFESLDVGTTLNGTAFGNLLSPFTSTVASGTHTVAQEEDGNKYWSVKYTAKGNGVTFTDATTEKLLNTTTWKISMRVKFSNDTDNVRFLSWRDASNTERALLSYYNGKLGFGKNGSSSWYTVIAEGETIKKDNVYQWINVALEMDPINRTYKVYIDNELVLYTEAVTNDIYKLVEGQFEKQPAIDSDRTPFESGGTVDKFYGFHQSLCEMAIDDLKIEILDYLPAQAD